jgi:hypothetical protein
MLTTISSSDVPSVVRVMIGLASTHNELNQGEKSVELYEQILKFSEEALGSEDEDLSAPLMHLGSSLLDEGRVAEAEMTIERSGLKGLLIELRSIILLFDTHAESKDIVLK